MLVWVGFPSGCRPPGSGCSASGRRAALIRPRSSGFKSVCGFSAHRRCYLPCCGAPGDGFGQSVGLSARGSTALAGAFGRNPFTGAAHVFTLRRGTWSRTAELTASDAAPGDEFGYSVALSALGTTALAGAPFRNTSTGAVYVFTEGRGA